VFRDYLPHIVGPDIMRRQLGRYPGYNANVDPSIANVFATAALRFAHLAIQPLVSRLDENYRENSRLPSVPLYEAFFTPWRVVFEGEFYREQWSNLSNRNATISQPKKVSKDRKITVNLLLKYFFMQ